MSKAVGWIALAVAAAAIAVVLVDHRQEDVAESGVATNVPRQYEQLSDRVADLNGRLGDLEQLIAELQAESRIASVDPSSSPADDATLDPVVRRRPRVVSSLNKEGQEVQALVAAGFSQYRAEQIAQRADELALRVVETRYAQENASAVLDSRALEDLDPNRMLREELGDTDYENYARATGLPTEVTVTEVFSNSPAEFSGIRAGDQILSYDGTRVFAFREVRPLTQAGTPGESVLVDLIREDQTMQIVVPRGPLGVSLSDDGPLFANDSQE